MERSDFLKGVGLLGAGALLPADIKASGTKLNGTAACTLIPSETAGPFPLDLTTDNSAKYFRQDVREDRTGAQVNLKMKIVGENNCLPMQNVRVNIWMCDKDGVYSGYAGPQNPGGSTATTYLRGYQMTDANGEVDFVTILPGWYNGRVCHIHFQVYVSSVYAAVSQLTFPVAEKNAIYAANPGIYTKGADPLAIGNDGVFANGYALQLATLTDNGDGTHSSYLEVTIKGDGTATGLASYEGETGGHFKLGQNFPNPYTDKTVIPFTLNTPSEVKVEIYDLNARKVGEINKGLLGTGNHTIDFDPAMLNIPAGNYLYQIDVTNAVGVFRHAKMMTAQGK